MHLTVEFSLAPRKYFISPSLNLTTNMGVHVLDNLEDNNNEGFRKMGSLLVHLDIK